MPTRAASRRVPPLPRSCAGALLVVAALAAGCGQGSIDVDAAPVAEARAAAEADIRAILASVEGDGTEYGRGRADGCAGGQDNLTVTDPYRFFCGKGEVVVIGLGNARDADEAARLADEALAGACPGTPRARLSNDRAGLEGLRAGRDAYAVVSYSCGAVYVDARVLRAKDGSPASELSLLPIAAAQRVVEAKPLDGPAAVLRAAESGESFVLALHATTRYFEQPRD